MFRPAKSAPTAWNLTKTFVQIAVFWIVFLVVFPRIIRFGEHALGVPPVSFAHQRLLGAILLILFSGLGLWSGVTMSWLGRGTPLPVDAPRELVIRGPYAYVRNPMAVAGLGQAIAIGIGLGSIPIVLYALAGGIIWHWYVRPFEEADLARRFGAPYDTYCGGVRCWVPRVAIGRTSPTSGDKEDSP